MFAVRPEGKDETTYFVSESADLFDADAVLVPEGGRAQVIGLAESFGALQLSPGPLSPAALDDSACEEVRPRPLPSPVVTLSAVSGGWEAVEEVGSDLANLRIPALDLRRCLLLPGHCPSADRGLCSTDCPSLATMNLPSPPTPPEAPTPPEPPAGCSGCMPGEDPICPDGWRYDVVTAECVALGGDCPVSGFPEPSDRDPPTVYVERGAAGGDGSRGAPFANIETALARSPVGTRVLIGPGRHVAPSSAADIWLEGTCAPDVVLLGNIALSGTSTLAHLVTRNRLRVENATLRGLQVGELANRRGWLNVSGHVRGEDLRTVGGGLGIEPGAHVDITGCDVETSGHGADTEQADVRLSGCLLRQVSGDQAVVRIDHGRLELERSKLRVFRNGLAVYTNASSSVIRDLLVEGASNGRGRGLAIDGTSSATVTRTRLHEIGNVALAVTSTSSAHVYDFRALRSGSATSNFIYTQDSTVALSRVSLEGEGNMGIAVNGRPFHHVYSDISITGPVRKLLRVDGPTFELTRFAGGPATEEAIHVRESQSIEMLDVRITGPGQIGLRVGEEFHRAKGTVDRLAIEGERLVGIQMEGLVLTATNVRVEGAVTGIEANLSFATHRDPITFAGVQLSVSGTALFLGSLLPELAPVFGFESVDIVRATTGVSLPNCWPDQGKMLRQFHFGDVSVPVSYSP